jgi:hypothetical protein
LHPGNGKDGSGAFVLDAAWHFARAAAMDAKRASVYDPADFGKAP